MSSATGIELGLEIAIQRDEEALVPLYETLEGLRLWQVGDLISIGNRPERRLVINLTEGCIEVIAESGWWNRYQARGDIPIVFNRTTGLTYNYTGREALFRDYKNGVFTHYFNQPNNHE
jgi:hypothetical protein